MTYLLVSALNADSTVSGLHSSIGRKGLRRIDDRNTLKNCWV